MRGTFREEYLEKIRKEVENEGCSRGDLYGVKLPVDDLDHPLDLLGRDGPGPGLLPQQVHHVRGELLAPLGSTGEDESGDPGDQVEDEE